MLADRLAADGWQRIGRFGIEGRTFNFRVDLDAARDWELSLYAWVSSVDGGTVLRVGKCHGRLATRLAAYKRSLEDVMSGRLGENQHFKGDTKPWERELWLTHAVSPRSGLIFAQQIGLSDADHSVAESLKRAESAFIREYDPPGCGVSAAGRALRRAWEAKHGRSLPISKKSSSALRPPS